MFNDYLHNPDCYFRLERSFYEFFRLEAQTNKIDIRDLKHLITIRHSQMARRSWMAIPFFLPETKRMGKFLE